MPDATGFLVDSSFMANDDDARVELLEEEAAFKLPPRDFLDYQHAVEAEWVETGLSASPKESGQRIKFDRGGPEFEARRTQLAEVSEMLERVRRNRRRAGERL